MKVFCRFAPPQLPPVASSAGAVAEGVTQSSCDTPLLIRLHTPSLPPDHATGSASCLPFPSKKSSSPLATCVRLVDPATSSTASFTCDGVMLSPAAASEAVQASAPPPPQQQQQLYEVTCRALQGDAGPHARLIYLAYGQTASGKTYSLFGGTARRTQDRRVVLPTAGVVPRYLHDVFRGHNGDTRDGRCPQLREDNREHRRRVTNEDSHIGVFVDLSCFEIYNEVTTDLVALAASRYSCGTASSDGGTTSVPTVLSRSSFCGQRERPPTAVQTAYERYFNEHRGDSYSAYQRVKQGELVSLGSHATRSSATSACRNNVAMRGSPSPPPAFSHFFKVEFKSTEKQQVRHSLQHARCLSFAEAQTVVDELLSLRQECATTRNQCSSRGHLVLCIEVYGPCYPGMEEGRGEEVWRMRHETAFVDLAGSERGPATSVPTEALRSDLEIPGRRSSQRARIGGGVAAVRLSRTNSQPSRSSLETSQQSGSSSLHSGGAATAASASLHAYHRYLLHPPLEEDRRATQARRLRETRCINASLLALRKVFRVLSEATQWSRTAASTPKLPRRPPLRHAPFKDSALTTILEPFLVPPAADPGSAEEAPDTARRPARAVHVVLLLCCSVRSEDFFETVASLRLGAEATAVNPEVVLRALPVQQREHELLQAQDARRRRGRSLAHERRGSTQLLYRSVSAPYRWPAHPSRDMSCSSDTSSVAGEGRTTGLRNEGVAEKGKRLQPPAPTPPGPSYPASTVFSDRGSQKALPLPQPQQDCDGEAVQVAQLRKEAATYKTMAQQLYLQCKSLCDCYDESVKALGRCQAALRERDVRIAELEAALAHRTLSAADATHVKPVEDGAAASHLHSDEEVSCSPPAFPHKTPSHPRKPQGCSAEPITQRQLTPTTGAWGTTAVTAMWNSGMREGSSRPWMVSVSPLSAASPPPREDGNNEEESAESFNKREQELLDNTSKSKAAAKEQPLSSGESGRPTSWLGQPQEKERATAMMQALVMRQGAHSLVSTALPKSPVASPDQAGSPSPTLSTLSAWVRPTGVAVATPTCSCSNGWSPNGAADVPTTCWNGGFLEGGADATASATSLSRSVGCRPPVAARTSSSAGPSRSRSVAASLEDGEREVTGMNVQGDSKLPLYGAREVDTPVERHGGTWEWAEESKEWGDA